MSPRDWRMRVQDILEAIQNRATCRRSRPSWPESYATLNEISKMSQELHTHSCERPWRDFSERPVLPVMAGGNIIEPVEATIRWVLQDRVTLAYSRLASRSLR